MVDASGGGENSQAQVSLRHWLVRFEGDAPAAAGLHVLIDRSVTIALGIVRK